MLVTAGPHGTAVEYVSPSLAELWGGPLVASSPGEVRALIAGAAGAAPRAIDQKDAAASPRFTRVRELLRRDGGLVAPPASEATATEASQPAAMPTFAFVDALGDVTGDGVADVVTGASSGEAGEALQVRRGHDGAVLWEGPSALVTYFTDARRRQRGRGDVARRRRGVRHHDPQQPPRRR